MTRVDWEAMRLAFIIDPNKPTLENFCGTQGLSLSTAKKRSAADKWMDLRNQHWNQVELKATTQVADLQATVVARDMAQKLSQIQAMKMTALKYAGGTEDHAVAYEKPHEAVAAYERLEKLERLLIGESTEHIQVSDARAYARDVLTIVREEVMQVDILERIAARVTALSMGQRPDNGAAQRPLN